MNDDQPRSTAAVANEVAREDEIQQWVRFIHECENGWRIVRQVSAAESIMVGLALRQPDCISPIWQDYPEHAQLTKLSQTQREAITHFQHKRSL